MSYNSKFFVLRIVTWSYNCLLIIINYLKWYKCVQTNDFNQIEIITRQHIIITGHWYNGLSVRQWPGRPGFLFPGRVIPKTQKMVLDSSLLNTRHYKVRINGKMEQFRERSSALPFEKGTYGSPSTTVANFTFFYITINMRWGYLKIYNFGKLFAFDCNTRYHMTASKIFIRNIYIKKMYIYKSTVNVILLTSRHRMTPHELKYR